MYRLKYLLLSISLFLIYCNSIASNINVSITNSGFIPQKGQFADDKGNVLNDVLFKYGDNQSYVYITKWGLSYFFINQTENKKSDNATFSWERIDMVLENADISNKDIELSESYQGSFNYFYAHCPNGITNIKSYQQVTIKNIYPGIDWVLHANNPKIGFKYDFVVHPNVDMSQINWRYYGIDGMEIVVKNKSVQLHGKTVNIKDDGLVGIVDNDTISMNFLTHENQTFSFQVKEGYDREKELIIDPELIWSTYYGGSGNNDGGYSIVSNSSHVFVTGTANTSSLPLQNPGGGAYFDNTYNGGVGAGGDAVIMRFTADGVREWVTFYGGSANETGQSISVDGSAVWITGTTASTNFPTLNAGGGAYFQASNGGGNDAFILKFNLNGARQWATYYGGSGSEFGGYSISSDGTNVWAAGETRSTNFPTQNAGGAYFDNTLSGAVDAYILKFNVSGVRQWATYYGGTGSDFASSIMGDGTNVWVTGTAGATVPALSAGGAYNDATANGTDAFLLKFNTNGTRQWATHYGGTGSDEGLTVHSDGTNVFLFGRSSSTNLPVLNPGGGAYFQATNGGSADAFIAKFNTGGTRQWATYYGGNGNDGGISTIIGEQIMSDGNFLWVAGRTSSSNLPTLNPGGTSYFQGTRGGGFTDAYLLQFDLNGVRQWGTYFSGNNTDMGMALHSNGTSLFVTGIALSSNFPTVNPGGGAFFDGSNTSGNSEIFISKFNAGPCGACTKAPASSTLVWTGCIDNNWFDECNWDQHIVPTNAYDVIIPNGTTNTPRIISGAAICKTITIQTTSTTLLDIVSSSSGTLEITN